MCGGPWVAKGHGGGVGGGVRVLAMMDFMILSRGPGLWAQGSHTSSFLCPFRSGRKEPWFFLELESSQKADWRPPRHPSPTS